MHTIITPRPRYTPTPTTLATMECYNDFGTWLRSQFPFKVQKISVDGGFTCPNRDGRISHGGCAFCDNNTFSPAYCRLGGKPRSILEQIEEGKRFFSHKYPEMRYLAYFQSYSNTYAPLDTLKRRYEEALQSDGVVGIVIGTRPVRIQTDIELVFPAEFETCLGHGIVTNLGAWMSLGQIGGVGSQLVHDDTFLHIVLFY